MKRAGKLSARLHALLVALDLVCPCKSSRVVFHTECWRDLRRVIHGLPQKTKTPKAFCLALGASPLSLITAGEPESISFQTARYNLTTPSVKDFFIPSARKPLGIFFRECSPRRLPSRPLFLPQQSERRSAPLPDVHSPASQRAPCKGGDEPRWKSRRLGSSGVHTASRPMSSSLGR